MKNIEDKIDDLDRSIAKYKKQVSILQLEILKLEIKKEKLTDHIFLQSLKQKIAEN